MQDMDSTLKRAEKHLRYFARQVYTDKIIMCMLVLVVLAIIAVIILTIVKGGSDFQIADVLKRL
jgi:novel plant SNARE